LLDVAHQQLGDPLVVVWDNLKTHVSAAMDELITARGWLTVFQLPPYAHELNPVELVWSHLKRSLANLAKRNLAQLTALVKIRAFALRDDEQAKALRTSDEALVLQDGRRLVYRGASDVEFLGDVALGRDPASCGQFS
jgi:DDE superfamily endonuclease